MPAPIVLQEVRAGKVANPQKGIWFGQEVLMLGVKF
jgi:hypothetical protein